MAKVMTAEPKADPEVQDHEEAVTEDSGKQSSEADIEASNQEDAGANALAEAKAQVVALQDEMLRIRAEADNARKRAARDGESARKFALERFMTDLLEVKDNLERGLEASTEETATIEQLREGKELTLRTLGKALEKHGLVEINPVGEVFDPEQHEALSMLPSPDHEPNTVVTVIQKGYILNGRLLRPARVMIAKED